MDCCSRQRLSIDINRSSSLGQEGRWAGTARRSRPQTVLRLLRRVPRWQLCNRSSVQTENAEADLADDALASDGFGEEANHKAQHGDAAIERLSLLNALRANLSCSSLLVPAVSR